MTDPLAQWQPGEGFYFEHRDRTIVATGAQRTITIPAGQDQVARAADAAAGSFVVGALPFAPTVPATLTVPADLDVRDGPAARHDLPSHEKSPLRITSVPAPQDYVDAVEKARARIRAGELDKVVLARMLVAQATHTFDRRALLAHLRAVEPDAYVFAAHGFIGASPELLVSRLGSRVRAQPLAGTIARGPDAEQILLTSVKDRTEHEFVVEAVRAALEPVSTSLRVEGPSVVATSKVLHLATSVEGELRAPAPTSLELAARLHPTPAVCGTPTAVAQDVIGELEAIDRALYAGLVGWSSADGDGEWAVSLRCAEVAGRIALLFAGAGIVADSDPAAELAETDAKFRSMLEALGQA